MRAEYPNQRASGVSINPDSFWGRWQSTAFESTLPSLLRMLKDTGRWDMWDLEKAADPKSKYMQAGIEGQTYFWESDSAKWLEGACYFVKWAEKSRSVDSEVIGQIKEQIEALVNSIISAQRADGYLNVFFTLIRPGKAWTNVRDMHEMYNSGHLIEAAVAYAEISQDQSFLEAMLKNVHHIASIFGPEEGKKPGYPGHPEIELALLRLYEATEDKTCLDLARYFLAERGRDEARFYRDEQIARGDDARIHPGSWPMADCEWYQQAQCLIVDQKEIQGHAVRAGYLLTGLADLCVQGQGTDEQVRALWRLWNNMIGKKASVTGGIGSEGQWEGFSRHNYDLPNGQDEGGPYNETCAGISLLMLADRLQQLVLLGKAVGGSFRTRDDIDWKLLHSIGDIAERILYNSSITSGMSLDGQKFTYENRLASSPRDPCKRYEYFSCSCCPPNVLRIFGVLGGYFWTPLPDDDDTLVIMHPFSGAVEYRGVCATVTTDYPLSGALHLDVKSGTVILRIPSWSTFTPPPGIEYRDGFALFPRGEYSMDLRAAPRLIWSHPYTNHNTLTVAYGPLIMCIEDVDNEQATMNSAEGHFRELTISEETLETLSVQRMWHHFVSANGKKGKHETTVLKSPRSGRRLKLPPSVDASLTFPELSRAPTLLDDENDAFDLVFVPYYFRANRADEKTGSGDRMRVSLINGTGLKSRAKGGASGDQDATGVLGRQEVIIDEKRVHEGSSSGSSGTREVVRGGVVRSSSSASCLIL